MGRVWPRSGLAQASLEVDGREFDAVHVAGDLALGREDDDDAGMDEFAAEGLELEADGIGTGLDGGVLAGEEAPGRRAGRGGVICLR